MSEGKANKVKFNIKNVHYALLHEDESGSVTWDPPVNVPGAVSISLDASGEITPFYADGMVYYQTSSNTGYEGDLEMALIPDSFRIDILKEQKDSKGVLIENANVETAKFALLFEFDGDQKSVRHVLYNCTATRPSVEGETTEDTKEPTTETLSISAAPLADGKVKAKTGADTEETTYTQWYDSVYVPADGAEPAKAGSSRVGQANV